MCRLFAYSTKNPESTELLASALRDFKELSVKGCVPCGIPAGHMDGWGIVAYKNGFPALYVRSTSCAESDPVFTDALNTIIELKPEKLIAHLRKTTSGGISIQNTHPFLSDTVALCHNGTMHALTEQGSSVSDSLRFFRQMLKGEGSSGERFFTQYEKAEKGGDYTAMNMLFADDTSLIVARNWNESNPKAQEQDLQNYYTLFAMASDECVFVCSEKLASLSSLRSESIENKTFCTVGEGVLNARKM